MWRLLASLALLQYIHPMSYNTGTNMGCIVTKNLLFSQGNLIRQLRKEELEVFKKYKKELHTFNNKINDAFDKAEETESKNGTVPPMPIRPTLPSFCTGPDTTVYIFGACSVQNNKLYVGHIFARELEDKERVKLADFSKKIASVKPGTTPPPEIYKGLEFCTEL